MRRDKGIIFEMAAKKLKKALIITYFFPPAQSVAGARAFSWAVNFKSSGIHPTIITRHWKGDETKWADLTKSQSGVLEYEQLPEYDIYKLPTDRITGLKIYDKYFSNSKAASKLIFFFLNVLGHFNTEAETRTSFKTFLKNHLKNNNYDILIVSSPPLNIIRLAVELKKEYNIPLHIDFRDLWNNEYLDAAYVPSFKVNLFDGLKLYYLKKWLKAAGSISTVSKPIAGYLEKMFNKQIWVLTNGFQEELYKDLQWEAGEKFRISLMGSYYRQQKLEILIDGLKIFLKGKKPVEVTVLLLGLHVNESILNNVLQQLPAEFINVIDRVEAQDAAKYAVNTDIILHAAWSGYKGIYTTKLFDFVASGNNILMAPGDHDVADALINETGTGKIAWDAEQVAEYLENWFMEWKTTGKIVYHGNRSLIAHYNRKLITEEFAIKLKEKYA